MRVEDLLGVRTHRLDDVGAVGNVRNKMSVHHVEMDPVGAGRIDIADFLAEPGKIRGEHRRRDDEGAWRERLGHGASGSCWQVGTVSGNTRAQAGQCGPKLLLWAEISAACGRCCRGPWFPA